jgi:hypothetical protein
VVKILAPSGSLRVDRFHPDFFYSRAARSRAW